MWVKILCHINFVRLVTADYGGSMINHAFPHRETSFRIILFINSFTMTSFKITNTP